MSNSNGRNKECDTVHHLVSRIAHRVYFLEESERMDFLEMARRAAEFTGIQLIGWCVMTNHFHLLVHLPVPTEVDETEVLRRYGILKGKQSAAIKSSMLAAWRAQGEAGAKRADEWLARQRRRMYDVGEFMKIVKQWFTEEYNRRHKHKGTLWESAYFDRVVPTTESEMAKCLGYIHLNPIRAAASDSFDGFIWSSYTAFLKDDPTAVAGMRFVYGDDTPIGEIVQRHEVLMDALLEKEKLRRAEEIARKRAAGYEMPADPLTTEAMIAQSSAHLAEVQKASMALRSSMEGEYRRADRRKLRDDEVLAILETNPEMDVPSIADRLNVGLSRAYAILGRLKQDGRLERDRRERRWTFPNSGNKV